MNAENSKINELQKFVLNLLERLDFIRFNRHAVLQNVSIY